MKEKIIGLIAFLIIRIIGSTLKYNLHFSSKENEEYFYKCHRNKTINQETKYLLAFFHQDELCLLNFFRNQKMSVLISISKDGEIMYNTARLLGYYPVRGSSSKKGVAGLIAGIRKVRAGYKMAFAVDGPRGPIYKVKDGIAAVAKKTNTNIIPVRAIASKQKIFEKSWNQAKFPLPFSKLDIYVGEAQIYDTHSLELTLKKLI